MSVVQGLANVQKSLRWKILLTSKPLWPIQVHKSRSQKAVLKSFKCKVQGKIKKKRFSVENHLNDKIPESLKKAY